MRFHIALLLASVPIAYQQEIYNVTLRRINNEVPLLNSQFNQSNFTYNYNPSYIPIYNKKTGLLVHDALLVRSQDTDNTKWGVGQSKMPLARFDFNQTTETVTFDYINNDDIVFESKTIEEDYGVEDPRVAYRELDQTYYMFYSAVETLTTRVASMLSLATTQTPWIKESWVRHGYVFPTINWSKSGALILRDAE
jgi:predicted GH43/DUF377 family glycosyl hydrolase